MKNFFRSHYKLAGLILLAVLCLVGVFRGEIEENMLALVPQSIRRQVQLFEHSPLSQKLIVVATSPTEEQSREAAQGLQRALADAGLVRAPEPPSGNIVREMLDTLPGRFSRDVEQQVEQKISAAQIAAQINHYYEQLFSLQSMFVAQLIAQDPFYLTEILFNKWAAVGRNLQTNYEDGLLTAREGRVQACLLDAQVAVSDLSGAQKLKNFFDHYQASLPANVRVFFMGGLRYTLENATLIKRDLLFITLAGLTGLSVIFFCLFRTKRALLIYALPFLVLPPAALVTQFVFGHLSGMTLGFGSVVAGLSVDYAIYVYFALAQTQQNENGALAQIRKHLRYNFLTSALCFAALFFASVEVFKQMAVFALVALSLSLAVSLWIFPVYFKGRETAQSQPRGWRVKPLPRFVAIGISALLLLFGAWGVAHVSFSEGLDSLNSTSKAFVEDKQVADELFASDTSALLFSLGNTPQEALQHNEELSTRLPEGLVMSELFASSETQEENKARWQEFWSEERTHAARLALEEEAQKKGMKPEGFAPFWQWLEQPGTQGVDFSAWYNPVLKLAEHSYAVVNIVSNDPVYAHAADGISAVYVSAAQLQKELVQGVKREALKVVCWALLLNMIAVGFLFKKIKETLLCFVPVLLGVCVLFGCLALFKIQVNLFGLIFLPLLIGLGIDYAIFQVMRFHAHQENLTTLYPTKALVAAGLSTLVGFGVLVLAKHAVLFMMGLCALLGIGGAIVAAVWLLPAFWERYV